LFALQLGAALRRLGQDVRSLYLYREAPSPPLELLASDRVLGESSDRLAERVPGAQAGILQGLLREVRGTDPDIVQANGSRTVKYVGLAALIDRGRRWRAVYRNIGDPGEWSHGLRRLVLRHALLPRFDGIVSVSEASRASLLRVYRPAARVEHIPRGVEGAALLPAQDAIAVRARLETPRDAQVLIAVGTLSSEKRIDRLLEAVAALSSELPNLRLWLVGDGSERSSLESQAERLGVRDAVRFLGVQPDVGTYLSAADLLVLTSDTEGMPGVVLEAAWCGLPAVATDVGGVRECLRDGRTGMLVRAGDAGALHAALRRLLLDASERERLGRAAHAWVHESFAMERVARQYLDFYRGLIGEPRP
jgi:glycosyltransferase involved in cell wall biosynthesis